MQLRTMNNHISPDLHVKVCKKVAQLTKVIYALNTKSDEQDAIINNIKENYEKDVEKIMYESKNKILQFKDQCQKFVEKEKEFDKISCLLKESNEEKKRLENQLKEVVDAYKLSERQLKNDYETKYLEIQNKVLERKQEFDELTRLFSCYQEKQENKHSNDVTQLTLKYHDEIKLLKESHLKEIDKLENSYLNRESGIDLKMKEYETIHSQLESEKQQIKDEYENKIEKVKKYYENEKNTLRSSLLKQNGELLENEKKELVFKYEDIISKYELSKIELNYRIEYLEKDQKEKKIKIENYISNCESLDLQIKGNIEKILKLEQILTDKDNMIQELKNGLQENDDKTNRIHSLRKHLLEANNKLKETDENHKKEIQEKIDSIKKLQGELKSLNKELQEKNATTEKLGEKSVMLQHECTVKTNSITEITQQKKQLEQQCKNLAMELVAKGKAMDQLNLEIEKLTLNHSKVVEKYENDMKLMQQSHAQNIERFKKESELILKESQGQLIGEWEKNRQEITNTKDSVIQSLEQEKENQKKLNKDLQAKFALKDIRIQQLVKEMEGLRHDIVTYTQKLKEMTKLYEVEKKKHIELTEEISKFKEASDEARKKWLQEKSLEIRGLKENFEEEKKEIIDEWHDRVRSVRKERNLEMMNNFKEEKQHLAEELSKNHEKRIERLRDKKNSEIAEMTKQIGDMETFMNEKEKNFENMKISLQKVISKLETQLVNTRKEWENKLIATESQLKDDHADAMKEEVEKLTRDKEAALEKQRAEFDDQVCNLQKEFASTIFKRDVLQEKQKEKELIALEEKLQAEKDNIQKLLHIQYDEKIKQLQSDSAEDIRKYREELGKIKEQRQKEFNVHANKISALSEELSEVKKQLKKSIEETNTLRKELEQKVEEILDVRRECNSRLKSQIDELTRDHSSKLDKIQAVHMKEMREAIQHWKEQESALMDRIFQLQITLEEFEGKFHNRPSREEDVELIRQLQHTIMEQEILNKKMDEERKQYRLELVNREANFNRMFNASPNVGVLNPIEINKKKNTKRKESTIGMR